MVFAVDETGATSIFMEFTRIEFASPRISFGIVAEKNKVCFLTGSFVSTFFTSFINHISSILSASSRINISTCLRFTNP